VCAAALIDPGDEEEPSPIFVLDAEEMTVMYKLHHEDLAVTAMSGFVSAGDGEARIVVGTIEGRVLVRVIESTDDTCIDRVDRILNTCVRTSLSRGQIVICRLLMTIYHASHRCLTRSGVRWCTSFAPLRTIPRCPPTLLSVWRPSAALRRLTHPTTPRGLDETWGGS
jgi:hypothetical protein